MNSAPTEFHKIWIEQCAAAEGIRERFGLKDALHYLIGEKLFNFVDVAEQDHDFAAELPPFVAEIRRIFSPTEIRNFLDELEREKYFAPDDFEVDLIDDADESDDEELYLGNPISAANELLRFFRICLLLTE